MKVTAKVVSGPGVHDVALTTNGSARSITIPPRSEGRGSSVNGGELLFLALATCYCNDIYREAARRGIEVDRVEVEVEGEFPDEGQPATNIVYHARVAAKASQQEIHDLMSHTDRVAEIQNTLRVGVPVSLHAVEAESI